MLRLSFLVWFTWITVSWVHAGDPRSLDLQGPYFGQDKPGDRAQLFGRKWISTGLYERDFAITPDGSQIFFTIMGGSYSVICTSKRIGKRWSEPEVAKFSGSTGVLDAEPHVTPDGKKLMFLSTRPPDGQDPTPGWSGHQNIWVADRTESGWGVPTLIGPPISSDDPEYFPSAAKSGRLYFTKGKKGTRQAEIWRSQLVEGVYQAPKPLPSHIKIGPAQYNASISPDETYLLFCANDPAVSHPEYFVAFRSEKDKWSMPIKLGEEINLPGGRAIAISVSPDGQYVFFSSNAPAAEFEDKSRSYELLHRAATQPQNGSSDVYWIDSAVVTEMRDQAEWP